MAQVPEHVLIALHVGEALDRALISHMVCGSIASSLHGEPRATYNVDFVVRIDSTSAPRLELALAGEFFLDPEAVRYAIEHGSSCNAIHQESAIKIDFFLLRPREFSRIEFGRRVHERVARDPDRFLWVTSPEDTIITKLEWYRKGGETSERQWRDVLGLVRMQGVRLDLPHIDLWTRELGLADLWATIRPAQA